MIDPMKSVRRTQLILGLAIAATLVAIAFPASRWWTRYRRQHLASACRQARDGRHWDELQSLAEGWSNWDPANADPWLFLAQVAQARHDHRATAEYLRRIPEQDPKLLPALQELSALEFGPLNQPLAGESTCKRILSLEPRATLAHQRLIQFYAMTMQRRRMVEQIESAIRNEREPPEAYVYLLLRDTLRLANGVELNEKWLTTDPDSELFQVARALQMPEPYEINDPATRNRQADKERQVDELLEKYPTNLELLAFKIERCVTLGDADCVTEHLLRSPPEAESDSRFWRFRGWLHETNDQLEEASAAYHRALELHPLDWFTLNRLAQVNRRLKNTAEVDRLTALVEQAGELRHQIRKLPAVERVTTTILGDLEKYASACGDLATAAALRKRLQ